VFVFWAAWLEQGSSVVQIEPPAARAEPTPMQSVERARRDDAATRAARVRVFNVVPEY
jgi:hypothetical protein